MMKIKFNELEIELNKVNIFIKEENELFILLHQIQNLDAVELYEKFIELLGKRIKYNNRAGEILQISNDGKNIKFDIQVQDNEKNDIEIIEEPVIINQQKYYGRTIRVYQTDKFITLIEGIPSIEGMEKIRLWGSDYIIISEGQEEK